MKLAAPERSAEQRLQALEYANYIRSYRAQAKRDLQNGTGDIVRLLTSPPEELLTMRVDDLLRAVRQFGASTVNKILQRTRTSPSKTLGGLSPRQRAAIISLVTEILERREERRAA